MWVMMTGITVIIVLLNNKTNIDMNKNSLKIEYPLHVEEQADGLFLNVHKLI